MAINDMNAAKASEIIGVDNTTVQGWCRKGIINCYKDSVEGKARSYYIPDIEVEYLKKLVRKWGKRKALQHYSKSYYKKALAKLSPEELEQTQPAPIVEDPIEKEMPVEEKPVKEIPMEEKPIKEKVIELSIAEEPSIKKEVTIEDNKSKASDKFDVDKLATTILYIREVKERIEDCKAELNQLQNEYAELKREVTEAIDGI